MPQSKTRCFVSLTLPRIIIDDIVKLQYRIKQAGLIGGKYTAPDNIHLTLKFLGEITYQQIDWVDRALSQISLEPFNVKLGEAGVFSKRHIRIIWMHLLGANEIQKKVDEALSQLFKPEERFMSHITMARVKYLKVEKEKVLQFLEQISSSTQPERIDTFTLKKSTLTPSGPIYETLKKYSAS
ncbi:2'-5' RNA ligase [Salinivirga cyanobacteriivorans]|uniref:RNA 2',3'-cyclic phosphodiesterase n=1 Tax=Salinivirga cyanobacteriivorans TaxID=1307839 RepID=A0A0S2I0D2_9BACT|nr:RNA 2',3'-cyclic phosphodiesterase [Salinivirga cyanobacteriivorans]ALO15744.1 2'-5' RNA ligase [Salinivirga cyanobacteriivorans]